MLTSSRTVLVAVVMLIAVGGPSMAVAQGQEMWPEGPPVIATDWLEEPARLDRLKLALARLTIDWTQYGIPGESLFEVFRYASRALSNGDEALLALDSAPTGCAFADGSGGVPKLQGGGLLAALGKVPNAPADVLPLVSTGQPTELVVLDEFDFTVLDLAVGVPKSLTKPAAGGSSSWSEWLVGTPGKSLDPEDAPHGHFVVYHLSELLGGAPGGASVEWLGGSFARVGIGQVTVLLADIDFESLPSVIQVLNNELIEGSGATLNLSWNIIDCDIFTGFEQELALHDEIMSLIHYFVKLSLYLQDQLEIATQESAVFEEVCDQLALPLTDCVANLAVAAIVDMGEKVTAYPDTAALAGLLAQRAGPVVGAAGNSGLAIAQPPASWDMVLGVGACELDHNARPVTGRAAFSNAASVASATPSDAAPYLAPGAWFSFEPQAIANGRTYWGTSFASPHVALLAAGGNWGAVGHACAPEPAN